MNRRHTQTKCSLIKQKHLKEIRKRYLIGGKYHTGIWGEGINAIGGKVQAGTEVNTSVKSLEGKKYPDCQKIGYSCMCYSS